MTELGWARQSMKAFFREHSGIPMADLKRSGAFSWIAVDASPVTLESQKMDPWPITARPENFIIICAGGEHPANSFWLQGYSPNVVGREIQSL